MRQHVLCVSWLLFVALDSAVAQTFKATVAYSEPSMGAGVLTGTIYYDWNYPTNPSYFLYFPTQNYSSLFQYNYNRGFTVTGGQWKYTYGPGCPGGCETGVVTGKMPQLFVDANYQAAGTQVVNGVTCNKYVPTATAATNNPVSSLLVRQTNQTILCGVYFTNGNVMTFSGQTTLTTAEKTSSFTPRLGCSCGKPIDISLVIDRSGSISVPEFTLFTSFILNLTNTFKIGPQQTQMAVTTFSTTATNILPLSNSAQAVTNAINSMKCNPDARYVGGVKSCVDGFTSISSGVQVGADAIATSNPAVRSYATHVMIVLTDGAHNTLADSAHTWCYDPCGDGQPVNTYTGPPYYDTCGDANKNFIPEDWEYGAMRWPVGVNTQWSPIARCHRDIINAREYAFKRAGDNLIIFVVGITDLISKTELEIVSNNIYKIAGSKQNLACSGSSPTISCLPSGYIPCGGRVNITCFTKDMTNPERVITSPTWDALGSTLLQLTSQVCDSNAQPCGTCCGYCKCGTCSAPDSCPTNNTCDVGVLKGTCCDVSPRNCTPSNNCVTSQCVRSANNGQGACVETPITCNPTDACYTYACQNGVCRTTLRAIPAQDLCHTSACVNGVLFNNTPKVCSGPDACLTYSCNVSNGNCISTPKPFPAPQTCRKWLCNSSGNPNNPFYQVDVCACNTTVCNTTTGICVSVPLCPDSPDVCTTGGCYPENGTCWTAAVQCRSSDACVVSAPCSITNGGCVYRPVVCNDNNPCTTDACVNGNCVYTNRTDCVDSDPCTQDSCEISSGACVFSPRNCMDNDACTIDSCNSSLTSSDPCVHTPIDVAVICNDNNLCTDDTCNSADTTGNPCRNTPYNVTQRCTNVTDPCTYPVCLPTFGCRTNSRVCIFDNGVAVEADPDNSSATNQSASDCTYAICSADTVQMTHRCSTVSATCGYVIPVAYVVAGALTGGAIAGIVIALIICCAAAGGGSYAAYTRLSPTEDANIHNSPLYVANTRGGENPLFDGQDN